ncbi:MAG: hypothetical protein FWF88_06510 [Peptococcaceae bacterium]|nr:hypothetical protein [Peptococcaceae bacterium]
MNKSEIVTKIIGGFLEQNGFKYESFDEDEIGRKSWSYFRLLRQIKQSITINDRPGFGLDLILYTNGFGQNQLHLKKMQIPEGYSLNTFKCFDYETEADFIRGLEMFRYLIEYQGFQELEKRSFHKSEARCKEETDRYLYENLEELINEYSMRLGIDPRNLNNWKEKMEMVFREVIRLSSQDLHIVEKDVLGLAAVYGEIVATLLDRQWAWRDIKDLPHCIIDLSQYSTGESPTVQVFQVWRTGKFDDIIERNERRLIKKQNNETLT